MGDSEYHGYSAPAKFEVISNAEKPEPRIIVKENLGEISVSNVVSIGNRYDLRKKTEEAASQERLDNPYNSTYNANIDSGESQETIYPHMNMLDLPPQSE